MLCLSLLLLIIEKKDGVWNTVSAGDMTMQRLSKEKAGVNTGGSDGQAHLEHNAGNRGQI
jgi:hypothetical protein